jgi:hypothetical protein
MGESHPIAGVFRVSSANFEEDCVDKRLFTIISGSIPMRLWEKHAFTLIELLDRCATSVFRPPFAVPIFSTPEPAKIARITPTCHLGTGVEMRRTKSVTMIKGTTITKGNQA